MRTWAGDSSRGKVRPSRLPIWSPSLARFGLSIGTPVPRRQHLGQHGPTKRGSLAHLAVLEPWKLPDHSLMPSDADHTGSSHHRSVAHPPFTPPQGSLHSSIAGTTVPGRDAPGTTFEAAVTGVTFAVTDSTFALSGRRTQRRAGRGNRRGGQDKRDLVHHDAPPFVRRCLDAPQPIRMKLNSSH